MNVLYETCGIEKSISILLNRHKDKLFSCRILEKELHRCLALTVLEKMDSSIDGFLDLYNLMIYFSYCN